MTVEVNEVGIVKKRITVLGIVFVLLISSLQVYAGDIPESLLHSEDAQIFFGEVLAYHPNKETPTIEVSPVKKIKGNVKEGTKQIYKNPWAMGSFHITVGKVYLFTYYDDANSTDVFEVTTYDTRTLKLKHVEGSMWDRFEKYLNDGEYGEARIEGMMPYTVDIVRGVIVVVAGLVILGVLFRWRKKRREHHGIYI